jgi:hypothetical protein
LHHLASMVTGPNHHHFDGVTGWPVVTPPTLVLAGDLAALMQQTALSCMRPADNVMPRQPYTSRLLPDKTYGGVLPGTGFMCQWEKVKKGVPGYDSRHIGDRLAANGTNVVMSGLFKNPHCVGTQAVHVPCWWFGKEVARARGATVQFLCSTCCD